MSLPFNYRHLYYFWVVAKEGGMSRAADRLGVAVQTVSAQVRELEQALGHALLKPAGRGLALTEAGQLAVAQADEIFQLGERLAASVRESATRPAMRLAVGIADGIPKLVVQRLMQPVMHEPHLKLLCHENEFDNLLAELALHRVDVVLADRPAPTNPSLRLYSHALGSSEVGWYASKEWQAAAKRGFPHSLDKVPVLLPTRHAAVRAALDRWFEAQGLQPMIVGEFEDSALLKTFGSAGMGVFPAPAMVHDDLLARYGVGRVGMSDGVTEHYFAIGTEKKVGHPLVARLLPERRSAG